jgi:hypothetical protein
MLCTEESRELNGPNKAGTLIRRHGNKGGMNARCKDPPHSILGSHERVLHMLLHVVGCTCTQHAIPGEPSLSCLVSCDRSARLTGSTTTAATTVQSRANAGKHVHVMCDCVTPSACSSVPRPTFAKCMSQVHCRSHSAVPLECRPTSRSLLCFCCRDIC